MSKKKLKIIIFDGSFKTTTFINRLVKGLVNEYDVYIMGFNEQLNCKIPKVQYVPLGSNQNYFRLAYVSLKYALQSKKINFLFNAVKQLTIKGRKNLQQQNLSVALSNINPDIIHLQWLSNISLFEPYIVDNSYKFILSQRGYHVNVRPFINSENFEYLQKWYPKIAGFHSVSNAIKLVSENIYTSPNKIDHVVYSGFEFSKLNFKQHLNELNESIKILSIGRNHWKKGYIYAIHAMHILLEQQIDFHYTIVGIEADEELLYLIDSYNLHDYITILPTVSQQEVYHMMNNYTAFLLPSLEEGIANVCIEAMAVGLPVISTNCGGMQELISDNETGFIVPVCEPKAIAEKVILLKNMSFSEVSQLTNKARLKVEAQHNEKKMIEGMLQLYKKIII